MKKKRMKMMKIDGEKYTKEEVKLLLNSMKKRIKYLEEKLKEEESESTIHVQKNNLKNMFDMQEELQAKMFDKLTDGPIDSVEDFHYSITALVAEIGEVLTADRRWKNARNAYFEKDEKLEELVDCMAFLINAVLYSGFDSETFYNAFAKKNVINMNR